MYYATHFSLTHFCSASNSSGRARSFYKGSFFSRAFVLREIWVQHSQTNRGHLRSKRFFFRSPVNKFYLKLRNLFSRRDKNMHAWTNMRGRQPNRWWATKSTEKNDSIIIRDVSAEMKRERQRVFHFAEYDDIVWAECNYNLLSYLKSINKQIHWILRPK